MFVIERKCSHVRTHSHGVVAWLAAACEASTSRKKYAQKCFVCAYVCVKIGGVVWSVRPAPDDKPHIIHITLHHSKHHTHAHTSDISTRYQKFRVLSAGVFTLARFQRSAMCHVPTQLSSDADQCRQQQHNENIASLNDITRLFFAITASDFRAHRPIFLSYRESSCVQNRRAHVGRHDIAVTGVR